MIRDDCGLSRRSFQGAGIFLTAARGDDAIAIVEETAAMEDSKGTPALSFFMFFFLLGAIDVGNYKSLVTFKGYHVAEYALP